MPLLISAAYFPPVSYIAACVRADGILIESEETYVKQTCRNHCSILGANGRQLLSVPVHKVNGNHTLIRDIRLAETFRWQQIHRRSIESAYRNSPFFLYYQDYFLPFFERPFGFLLDLDLRILETVLDVLRVDQKISLTRTWEQAPEGVDDQREVMVSKHRRQDLKPYPQVFGDRFGFMSDLSILDLIFNLGPEASEYLLNTE